MTLRLPECLPYEEVDEWIDATVQFSIERWDVMERNEKGKLEQVEYWCHGAEAIGPLLINGAPRATQSNFERCFFAVQEDDDWFDEDEPYEFDEDGYLSGWHLSKDKQHRFADDNEEAADNWVVYGGILK